MYDTFKRFGAIFLASAASGCSLISVEPVASPFPQGLTYGHFVREIRVEGNKHTKTWIVERAMDTKVGERYTEQSARNDYLWLSRLGSFTSVRFRTEPVDQGVALVVTVQEVSPWIPSISFALTQENGVEIGPGFSSPNFLGTAGRASASARFGGATNFGASFWDPWMPGKSWLFGYGLRYRHVERRNELDDFEETTDDLFFQYRRNLTNELRLGLRFSFLSVGSDTPGKTLSPSGRDNIPRLGLFLELDTRNGIYPTRGWYAELSGLRGGAFGGDGDYWQATGDLRTYFSLPFGRRHSMAFYSLATMTSGRVGVDIPVYLDFHIGGTNTVRGWPLGARVGKNEWLTTLEYWYRLMDDQRFRFWFIKWRMGFQLGAFGDVGTAWSSHDEFGDNFIAGFGAGFRLTIPVIVLIRIDAAYANSEFGIQIGVGGAEKAIAQRQRVR